MENEIEKIYFSIGEVAKMLNVNASLIRFWEKEFNIIKLQKNRKGNRIFTKKNIEQFQIIYNLLKVKGYTLEGARKELNEAIDDNHTKIEVIEKLKKIRINLQEIEKKL